MKILAFATSNSTTSINRQLAGFAGQRFKKQHGPDALLTTLDINDFEMPIFAAQREAEIGQHPTAQKMLETLGQADVLIVSFPEHNNSVTAAWKNIFDWASRIDRKIWQKKPTLLLSASPGGRAGLGVRTEQAAAMPRFGADLRGNVGVGNWGDAWDEALQTITNADALAELDAALAALRP